MKSAIVIITTPDLKVTVNYVSYSGDVLSAVEAWAATQQFPIGTRAQVVADASTAPTYVLNAAWTQSS